jgi:hypothetical protein
MYERARVHRKIAHENPVGIMQVVFRTGFQLFFVSI